MRELLTIKTEKKSHDKAPKRKVRVSELSRRPKVSFHNAVTRSKFCGPDTSVTSCGNPSNRFLINVSLDVNTRMPRLDHLGLLVSLTS